MGLAIFSLLGAKFKEGGKMRCNRQGQVLLPCPWSRVTHTHTQTAFYRVLRPTATMKGTSGSPSNWDGSWRQPQLCPWPAAWLGTRASSPWASDFSPVSRGWGCTAEVLRVSPAVPFYVSDSLLDGSRRDCCLQAPKDPGVTPRGPFCTW